MRVYSRSQRGFIDTQDQGGITSGSSSIDEGGMNKIFATMMLQNPKQAGTLKSVFDILKPDAATVKTQQEKQKKLAAAGPAGQLVETLERHYQGAGGAETGVPILNVLKGVQKNIGAALGFNDEAKQYNDQKRGFIAALRELTGDVGVLTEQDAQRLMGLFPALGDKPEVAKGKFNDIRNFINAKFGATIGGTTIKPANKGLFETIAPETTRYLSEAPQWLVERGKQRPSDIVGGVGHDVSTMGQLLGKAFMPAVETAGTIGLAKGATNLPSLVKRGISGGGGVFSQGAGQTLRKEAVTKATGKIEGNKIVEGMTKWAGNAVDANPGESKAIMKILNEVNSSYSGKKLVATKGSEIWNLIDRGFTTKGIAKTAVRSQADRALSDLLRLELERVAPGWEQGTKMISRGLRNKKIAQYGGGILAGGGLSAAAGAGMYGLLSRGR